MRSPTAASCNAAGEALNCMVIAGHPIERMGSWLMVIVDAAGSTAVITPAPSAVLASAAGEDDAPSTATLALGDRGSAIGIAGVSGSAR